MSSIQPLTTHLSPLLLSLNHSFTLSITPLLTPALLPACTSAVSAITPTLSV